MKLSKDFFFEFAGMPKSGKTTTLDIIVHYLKRQGFDVKEYHGGGRYAPIDKSAITSLNFYLACKAIEFILVSTERERVVNRIFILDRGLYDREIFTKALEKMGKISETDSSTLIKLLRTEELSNKIDHVFLFVTTPLLSIKRENQNKLVVKEGRVMNTDFLTILREISTNSTIIEKSNKTVTLIDTELFDGNLTETSQIIVNKIMQLINDANR